VSRELPPTPLQQQAGLIKAAMLSPSDDTLRGQFEAFFYACALAEDPTIKESLIEIPGWIPIALADTVPGQNLAQKMETAECNGSTAGELLCLFYSFRFAASRTGEIFKNVDSFSSLKLEVARHRGVSGAWVQKSWDLFKPVAHLWAAAYVEKWITPGSTHILEPSNLVRFTAVANCFERFAVSYTAARQHKPLVDPAKVIAPMEGRVSERALNKATALLEELVRYLARSDWTIFSK
jgi:hypothetical protein